MIRITKWFDQDTISEYIDKVVDEVKNKTNTKYGTDEIKYIEFGAKSYKINVVELLTLPLNVLRKKHPGLDLYIYLCGLRKYRRKTRLELLKALHEWDVSVIKENGSYIFLNSGLSFKVSSSNQQEYQKIREYVIKKIEEYDIDIYNYLIQKKPGYYLNCDNFNEFIDYIIENLAKCLYEQGAAKSKNSAYDTQSYIIHYSLISQEMRDRLLTSLGVSTCPYCNRQYITYWLDEKDNGRERSTGDLDHFYIKSDFPLFALSLFNFIPSCQICNQRFKGSTIKNTLYPFDDEFGDKIQFSLELEEKSPNEELQLKKWLGAIDSNSDKLKLSLKPSENIERDDYYLKAKGSKELFNLEKVYDCHKRKAIDVVLKKRVYLEGAYQIFMNRIFEGMECTRIDLNKFLFGYDWDRDGFDDPLSKMTYDIFKSTK